MSAIQQIRPEELKNILLAEFQDRNEPNFAWKSACALYQSLPALRGFWPMSSVDYRVAVQAVDLSAQTNHLTNNNVVEFGYDRLAPYADFGGTNEYLSRADGGAANWADILGTEAYILAAQRGLTLGGWFYFDDAAGAFEYLMTKRANLVATRSYWLLRRDTGLLEFGGSNGVAISTIGGSTSPQSTWIHIVGRFVPSTTMTLFVNGTPFTNAAAIVASLNDSTEPFIIGARSDGIGGATVFLDGRASMCFLCAAALSDALIGAIYQQTRRMFEAS